MSNRPVDLILAKLYDVAPSGEVVRDPRQGLDGGAVAQSSVDVELGLGPSAR